MSAAAHGALARELGWMLAALGGKLTESSVTGWASGRLSGSRHAFLFECAEPVPPPQAQRIAAQIAVREFAIDDGFVADAGLSAASGTCMRIEALTLTA